MAIEMVVNGTADDENIDLTPLSFEYNAEVHAGDGKDEITTGAGEDKLYGDKGNDILKAGDGVDELRGGDGDDELHGEAGADKNYGEAGDDTIYFDTNDSVVDGGADSDTLKIDGSGSTTDFLEMADSVNPATVTNMEVIDMENGVADVLGNSVLNTEITAVQIGQVVGSGHVLRIDGDDILGTDSISLDDSANPGDMLSGKFVLTTDTVTDPDSGDVFNVWKAVNAGGGGETLTLEIDQDITVL